MPYSEITGNSQSAANKNVANIQSVEAEEYHFQ